MDLLSYVLRRLVLMVPVVIGVTVIVFFMIHLIPGDPARTLLGVHATPAKVAALHKEWGLDQPLWVQYKDFMDRILHGNLGNSLYYSVPARGVIVDRIPPTLWLLTYSAVLSVLIAVPLAVI